jgi:hypothetical protein
MEAGSGCTGSSESEVMSAQSTSSIHYGSVLRFRYFLA